MEIDEIVALLGAKQSGGQWQAKCPAHDDRTASLSLGVKDGRLMIHCHAGCSFEDVMAAVGMDPKVSRRYYKATKQVDYQRNREKIQELWSETIPLFDCLPAQKYFDNRGVLMEALQASPFKLKAHPGLEYWDTSGEKPVSMGKYPAIVAVVENASSDIVSLHRTYITSDGKKIPFKPARKMMASTGHKASSAARIELFKPTEFLGVGEGIESVLAFRKLMKNRHGLEIPVWSCISANGLENCVIPKTVQTVFIIGDNDMSRTGQDAAYHLKDKLPEFDVFVSIPKQTGADMADLLEEEEANECE